MKFDLSHIEYSHSDIKRKITLPTSPSIELAEFIGILTGDGYMNHYPAQHKYIVEIAGDKNLDKIYLTQHVSNIIQHLFNLGPTVYIRKDQNSIYLRIISKRIYSFLRYVGFKNGKKGNISIPLWIQTNHKYSLHFIKGLADTDFTLYYRKKYPILGFTSISQDLTQFTFDTLTKNNIKISKINKEIRIDKRGYNNSILYSIKINGKNNLNKWLKLISFRNQRHLRKMGPEEFESSS